MSLPRYPAYKDSGVAWLGEVPGHWGSASLRWLSTRYSGGTPDKLNLDYWTDGTIPWLNSGEVNQSLISEPSTYITEEAFQNSSAKWIPQGALVMALAGQGKTKGMVAQLGIPTTCNQSMAAIIPTQEQDARFLFWWLTSSYQNIRNMAGGDLRDGLNLELLGNIPCPLVPITEQQAIAAFLDRETGKIDALIAEQRRLVELLNEEIISLVLSSFRAPETSELRLSEVSTIISRPVIQKADESYTRIGLFNRGRGLFHKDASEMDEMGESDFYWVEEGDLIISGQFAWEGAVALADIEDTGCVVSHRYPVIRGKAGVALTEYLLGLLCTKHGDFLLNENSRGAAGRNRPLNISSLMKEKIPVPSMKIQKMVARAVHARKALFKEITKAIALLQERRSALISAAVTGKIDVRHAVTPAEAGVQLNERIPA